MGDFQLNKRVFSLNHLRTAFFTTFAEIAPPLKPTKAVTSRFNLSYRLLFQLLHLLNLLSLVFPVSYQTVGYDSERLIWRVMAYSRYDVVLVALGSDQAALILAYCLTLTPLAVLTLSVSSKLLFPSLRLNLLKLILRFSLRILDEVLIIPTSTLLYTSIFSPFLSDFTYIYPTPPTSFGTLTHCLLSLFSLSSLLLLLYLQRVMLFDIRWLRSNSTLFARYTGSAHVRAILANTVLCLSTLLWHWKMYKTQNAIAGIVALAICWKFTYVAPFYSTLIGCVIPVKYLIVGSAVGERFLSEYLSSENTSWTLLICLSPILSFIYYQVYLRRLSLISLHTPSKRNFQLLILLKIRSFASHAEIQNLFSISRKKFPLNSQFQLLESLYFLLSKNNPEIAHLKASLSPVNFSLQSSFLRFRIIHEISSFSTNEKTKYVYFNSIFTSIKKLDEYFCMKFFEMLNDISLWGNNDVTKSVELFSSSMVSLERKYADLLHKYPRDEMVLKTFGVFLGKMKGEVEKGKEMIKKAEIIRKNVNTSMDVMSEPMFICRVSASFPIIFANTAFNSILTANEFLGVVLEDLPGLLPQSMRETHLNAIRYLLGNSEQTTFAHSDVFLLLKGLSGILVNLTVEFIAVLEQAYLCVTVHPKENYVQAAAISQGNLIFYTKDFLKVMECEEVPVVPTPIQELIPGYQPGNDFVRLPNSRGTLEIRHKQVKIGTWSYTLIETFNFFRRSKDRKDTIEPSLRSAATLLFTSKSSEKRELATTSTKFATSTSGNARDKDYLQKRRKKKVIRWTNLMVMITVAHGLMLIIEAFVMFAIYFQIIDEMDSVDTVNELGARRNLDVRIVLFTLELDLLSHGYVFSDSESSIRSNLQNSINGYIDIVGNVRENSTQWVEGTSKDMYTRAVVPVWTLMNGEVSSAQVSLMDAMSDYLLRAQMIVESDLTSLPPEDLFYIYQNGLGMTFHYLNISTFLYIHELQTSQLTKAAHVYYVSILLVAGTTLVMGALVAYVVLKLERNCSECWEGIVNADTGTVQKIWENVKDRLTFFHGLDTISIPPKKLKYVKKYTRKYKKIVVIVSFFAICSVVFFTFVYISAGNYVEDTMVTKANYMNWAGLRRCLTSLLSTLVFEVYLQQNSLQNGYFSLIKHGQTIPNFPDFLSTTSYNMHHAEQITTLGDPKNKVKFIPLSDSHIQFLYKNACVEMNITGCDHTSIALGTHLGLLDLLMSIRAFQGEVNSTTWTQVVKLSKAGLRVGNAFVVAADMFNADSSAALGEFRAVLWTYPGVYLVVALVMYPLVLLPVKAQYKRSLLAVWRVSSLFVRE